MKTAFIATALFLVAMPAFAQNSTGSTDARRAEQPREVYEATRAEGEASASVGTAVASKIKSTKEFQNERSQNEPSQDKLVEKQIIYCQKHFTGSVQLYGDYYQACADALSKVRTTCAVDSERKFCKHLTDKP